MSSDFSQYYEAREPGRRERAYGWATAIGLQAVDGLSPSQNLIETTKRHIDIELKNRHLKIRQEYGSSASDAIKNLQRRGTATVKKTVENAQMVSSWA